MSMNDRHPSSPQTGYELQLTRLVLLHLHLPYGNGSHVCAGLGRKNFLNLAGGGAPNSSLSVF